MNKTPILTTEQIEEVKYLEIADNPEYKGLNEPTKKQVQEKAIATVQHKATVKWFRKEVEEQKNPYPEWDCLAAQFHPREWLIWEDFRQKILSLLEGQ